MSAVQPGHEVVAQLHRVAAGVQAEAVLGRPGHPVVGRGHPGGQDQVVVVETTAVTRNVTWRRTESGRRPAEPGARLQVNARAEFATSPGFERPPVATW